MSFSSAHADSHAQVNSHAQVEGSDRVPLPGAVATGRTNLNAMVEVSVKVRRKQELPVLTDRPASPMSREQLADSYGAAQSDIDAVKQAFAKFGLEAISEDKASRTVRFRGTADAMEKAYQVKLFNFAHTSGNYRGRTGPVHVPVEVQDIVTGVFGLDSRRVARPRRNPVRKSMSHAGSVPSSWYLPSQLSAHYNFPPGDGKGQTVGLLEFGGGYFQADLKKFCSLAKIPTLPKVIPVSTDGTPTDSQDGDEGEVMLDIEVVAGVCPKATIVVYFAKFTEQGWITAIDAAVHDTQNDPGVLSVSWGYAEDEDVWTRQAMKSVNDSLHEAAMIGMTVCVAAGDDGSSDGILDGKAHADFPSSSPYVVAVGGTTIVVNGGNKTDIVWKEGDGLRADNGGSGGGGVSSVFDRPDWQKDLTVKSVNPGAIVGRCLPDISANADWTASPYLLVVDGKSEPNGGTSAAAPLVASLFTLINGTRPADKRVGFVTPVLYKANGGDATIGSVGCTDVQSGNINTDHLGGYAAGPGYDAASGWGTPDGTKLAQLIPQ
jgi:kumamolisin